MSFYDDVWQRTVTVVEKESDPKPVLYRPDGTPLAYRPPRVGFKPPSPKPKEHK